jgi:cytochrome d ubiquinol oxidase subunit II
MNLDLPLIWVVITAVAVLMYVVLDGFDLGVGILFPIAKSPQDRDVMMNTIAPIWDGNETWLILGGNALLAAFPVAYAALMPALYIPVLLMLVALILRGVSFEFRFRARNRGRRFWTVAFAFGSILATFSQGLILGGFIQGVRVDEAGRFVGSPFDWLSPYTLLVSFGLVAGYSLLSATWLVMKTTDALHGDARRWSWIALTLTVAFLAAVSLATLDAHPRVAERWGLAGGAIDWSVLLPLLTVPGLGAVGFAVVAEGLAKGRHRSPFVGSFLIFLSGFFGLAVGFYPYVLPYSFTFREAAAPENAMAFMLAGTAVILPMILGYTVYVYWAFRGKVTPESGYHH